MPISSRRCGMITKREAERLCKSFLGDNTPPKLPENFAFEVKCYIHQFQGKESDRSSAKVRWNIHSVFSFPLSLSGVIFWQRVTGLDGPDLPLRSAWELSKFVIQELKQEKEWLTSKWNDSSSESWLIFANFYLEPTIYLLCLQVYHECSWGCRGQFVPSRYNSSRAKCIKCHFCAVFFSPNKFVFHSHRLTDVDKYVQPDAANFNSWRRHTKLLGDPPEVRSYILQVIYLVVNYIARSYFFEWVYSRIYNANQFEELFFISRTCDQSSGLSVRFEFALSDPNQSD